MRSADKGEEGRKHLLYLRRSGRMGGSQGMSPDDVVVRHQGGEKPEEKSMDIVKEHLGSPQGNLPVINDEMSSPVKPQEIRGGAYGHED